MANTERSHRSRFVSFYSTRTRSCYKENPWRLWNHDEMHAVVCDIGPISQTSRNFLSDINLQYTYMRSNGDENHTPPYGLQCSIVRCCRRSPLVGSNYFLNIRKLMEDVIVGTYSIKNARYYEAWFVIPGGSQRRCQSSLRVFIQTLALTSNAKTAAPHRW